MSEQVESVEFTDIYMDDEMIRSVEDVLRGGRYVKGPVVEKFEEEFAEKCGVAHVVGVNSGTSAILLGLKALGIGEGDDVFVPGHTYFASVSPVLSLGANPVFVDVNPDTYTIDTEELDEKASEADSPEAIIPVHIYGQMADMEEVRQVADEHDMSLLSDSCQAHFSERNGDKAGSVADAGAFSFYPSKNMTVAGDGGMLVTDDDEIAEKARAFRNHGRDENGTHRYLGLNHRMSEMQGAVGRKQLEQIDDWNDGRRRAAAVYDERLSDVEEVVTPTEDDGNRHVYHLYVVQVPDRGDLREYLEQNGVGTGIHYETPAHRHPAVLDRVEETELPETERLCDRILSLPMHPRLSEDKIGHVCELIEGYYG